MKCSGFTGCSVATLACLLFVGSGCSDPGPGGTGGSGGSTFSVGGSVSGLAGTLVLENNGGDDLMVTEDGPFTFGTDLEDGASYDVTIESKPGVQGCRIADESGTIDGADETGVTVTCDHYVFFAGSDDADTDIEPWRTDGTEGGTVRIKAIVDGIGSSSPDNFYEAGDGTVLFSARSLAEGREPWITDGTEAGTRLLKDIEDGMGSSSPANFFAHDGVVYFSATTSAEGRELWKTDGTEAGTVIVQNYRFSTFSSNPTPMTELDGEVYFSLMDSDSDIGLHTTDGDEITRISETVFGNDNAGPPFAHDGLLYFSASTMTSGNELHISDGTTDGTELLKALGGDVFAGNPRTFTSAAGTLFFIANPGSPFASLFVTDGTEDGTVPVQGGSPFGGFSNLTAFDGALFFRYASDPSDTEPWRSDGTSEGTDKFIDINTLEFAGSSPGGFTVAGDLLFFSADDGDAGAELWATDGTTENTSMVRDINPSGGGGAFPMGVYFDQYIFSAVTPDEGYEPYITDGTEAGTVLIKDICPDGCSGFRGF